MEKLRAGFLIVGTVGFLIIGAIGLLVIGASRDGVLETAAFGAGGSVQRDGGVGGSYGTRDGGIGGSSISPGGTGGTCVAGTAGATGSITEFTLPKDFPIPHTLLPTPDGGIWLVTFGRQVAHYNAAGTYTTYTLSDQGCTPLTFNVDVCGNLLWASTRCAGGGRVSMTGTLVTFPLSSMRSGCRVLTHGYGGRFWFIDNNGPKIGVITSPP